MPRREEHTEQPTRIEYDYEVLLRHIRDHIDKEFGGVAKFLGTKDYLACGFTDTPNQRAKMHTYLSLPPKGESVGTKSFPVLKKLFTHLLGIELDSKIKVVRTQTLHSNTKIGEKDT